MNRSSHHRSERARRVAPMGLASALLAALLQGCIVTERESPSDPGGAAVHRSLSAVYDVRLDGAVVGHVHEYGSATSPQGHYYSVRNRWDQEVGMVDERGRFWAHRPHRDTPEHIGSGTLEEGVMRLLGLERAPDIAASRGR
ncbi:MAG: hypothetical protein R3F34_03690 [Planctomycetota bacterium]